MQANHIIGRLAYTAGAEDSHGNAAASWAAAVDVAVYAIYATTSEQTATARQSAISDLTVLLPAGSGFTARDRAIYGGNTFEVVGDLEPFGTGPFSFAAGDRLSLRRVEG
jgi:hypothetical protein